MPQLAGTFLVIYLLAGKVSWGGGRDKRKMGLGVSHAEGCIEGCIFTQSMSVGFLPGHHFYS